MSRSVGGRGSGPRGAGGGAAAPSTADMVSNGAFASDTAWTKGAGWTIAAGVATATASDAALSQSAGYIPGLNYVVVFTVSGFAAGTVTVSVGGRSGTARGSDATFTETIRAGGDGVLAFTAAGATLAVDNVSVRLL